MTSRELVIQTLEFNNATGRVPRDIWATPWAEQNHSAELASILDDFPSDIIQAPAESKSYLKQPIWQGDPTEVGLYTDEWGVEWKNVLRGLWGEVKDPIVNPDDNDWSDISRVHFPEELLTLDVQQMNAYCDQTEQFVIASDYIRPFERMHFLRGMENLLIDLAIENKAMLDMLSKVHDFFCKVLEVWAKTKVDALYAVDDWGSQRSLLIDPEIWRKRFKPLYKEYVDIAHRSGKKMFFHSDGFTFDIIKDLIELGFDAVNLQIFAIGIDRLAPFKGRINFWGEIDRQYLLPKGTQDEIDRAVRQVYETLWNDGGAMALCEFGPEANPKNVRQVFETWDRISVQ